MNPRTGRQKVKRSTQRNKADALFSRYIRLRDQRCQCCGSVSRPLQCAHVFSRRHYSTRFDTENAIALCLRCHMRFTLNPAEWEVWIENRMGVEKRQELRAKSLEIQQKLDYMAIIANLEQAIHELNSAPEHQNS